MTKDQKYTAACVLADALTEAAVAADAIGFSKLAMEMQQQNERVCNWLNDHADYDGNQELLPE